MCGKEVATGVVTFKRISNLKYMTLIMVQASVSYTHLDVYKRQGYGVV